MAEAIAPATQQPLADVLFGCAGWAYDDWRGVFYTSDVRQAEMLTQYGAFPGFDTVELDTTFYGFPKPTTLQLWNRQTPDGFRFSAKLPRAVTHERRLIGGASDIATDFGKLLTRELGDKLGALLVQLPPDLADTEREALMEFVDAIASVRSGVNQLPWVVEFRNGTWEQTDIAALLAERGMVTAITERIDCGGPLRYLRLLGTENSVARFNERQFDRSAELDAWAKRIDDARRTAPEPIYVYVRNFFEGHSPATIAELRKRLGLPNVTPPGQQQMSLFSSVDDFNIRASSSN